MYRICKNYYGYFKIQKTVKKKLPLWRRLFDPVYFLIFSDIEVWKDINYFEDVNYAKFPKVTYNNDGVALFKSYEDASEMIEYLIYSTDKKIKKNDNHWKGVKYKIGD